MATLHAWNFLPKKLNRNQSDSVLGYPKRILGLTPNPLHTHSDFYLDFSPKPNKPKKPNENTYDLQSHTQKTQKTKWKHRCFATLCR